MTVPTLRVAGAQIPNVVGDLAGNARRIGEAMDWAEASGADVVVFPELALTGYPLADLALRREFVDGAAERLRELAGRSGRTTAVVSTIDRVPPRRSWDTRERDVAISAAVLCDGEVRGHFHKVLLPNYDGFDEARTFAPGERPDALWRIGSVVAGILICEDMWSPDGPPEAQAANGARILLVPNASSFHREKPRGRLELASQVARRNGLPVVYVNGVGGQDELTFDGGSLIVDAEGELRYRAAQFEEERFLVDVPLGPERPLHGHVTTVHTRPTPVPAEPARPEPAPEAGDEEQIWEALVMGTRDFARRNGVREAVLGLSGGIDAAVTAAVAADALGPERVLALAMPEEPGPEARDAERVAEGLGIAFRLIPIGPALAGLGDAVEDLLDAAENPARGVLASRARAALLWAVADHGGRLPLATGNKSELSIGTAALHGDMAGAFAPLKDCPKTLVYRLARLRNERGGGEAIPREVIERVPSARVADEELLPPYEVLDPIVERYIERGEGAEELIAAGFGPAVVRGVLQLIDDAEFKRRMMPPGVKITARAFGADRRMPITSAWRPFSDEEPDIGDAVAPARSYAAVSPPS